ncbi:MAG: hypothetical protein AAGA58_01270 [Verrucomicrobiota bacterium]
MMNLLASRFLQAQRTKLCVAAAIIAIVQLGAGIANGQAIENEKLTSLRLTFESELEKRLLPLKDEAVQKLIVLEHQRAIREDYEGAIRARDRRYVITGDRAADEEEKSSEEGAVDLIMEEAQTSGNTVGYDRRRDALVGFQKPGQSVTWDISSIEPGWYKVMVTYGSAEPFRARKVKDDAAAGDEERRAGGTFRLYEDTALLSGGSEPLIKTVTPTGGWDRLVTRNIGRLKITSNRATIKLEVVEAENEGIMFLRKISLVPTAAPDDMAAFQPGGDDAPTQLRTLREQYAEQVDTATASAIENYIETLKEKETELTAAEKLDEALAARSERERAESMLSQLNIGTDEES